MTATAADVARLLVLEKAVMDVLADANAETREQARAIFEAADAKAVNGPEGELGRVRRDRPRKEWRVVDYPAYEAWVRAEVPEACTAVAGWLLSRIKRDGGVYIDKATGEIKAPVGIALQEEPEGRLVVTTTDAAVEWARSIVRPIAGEIE